MMQIIDNLCHPRFLSHFAPLSAHSVTVSAGESLILSCNNSPMFNPILKKDSQVIAVGLEVSPSPLFQVSCAHLIYYPAIDASINRGLLLSLNCQNVSSQPFHFHGRMPVLVTLKSEYQFVRSLRRRLCSVQGLLVDMVPDRRVFKYKIGPVSSRHSGVYTCESDGLNVKQIFRVQVMSSGTTASPDGVTTSGSSAATDATPPSEGKKIREPSMLVSQCTHPLCWPVVFKFLLMSFSKDKGILFVTLNFHDMEPIVGYYTCTRAC